jgi:mRNA-degrading endonuclease RelE of RelBE toxin-antitoxin system
MSQQMYRLDLPQEVLEQIRDLAKKSRRPVEDVIAESLSLLFGGEIAAEPEVLNTLTDKQLWMLVHDRLAPDRRKRLHALLETNQDAPLEGQDMAERAELQSELDRQTALRVEALAVLQNRGHDVHSYLNSHPE